MKSRKQTIWMLALAIVAVPVAVEAQYTFIDLNPSGFIDSAALGISGSQQVGSGLTGGNSHALLWSGTAASAVDLNPSGFTESGAGGISGSQQVGNGYGPGTGGNSHALLWSGTAASAVDLHPSGFSWSYALGVSGSQQVGNGTMAGFNNHALLWSGTAASAVDLHPSGFTDSIANGISGSQQVGHGYGPSTGGNVHALLWSGTAVSAVDLNPSGFIVSEALGLSGSQQVGDGTMAGGNPHALLWSGTAASAVDLHSFLSSNYTSSFAQGVDANSNIVGYAYNSSTGQNDAILWFPCSPPLVTTTADSGPGSLRAALACASDGDIIDATGVSGTILLTSGELLVTKSVTIIGPGPGNLAVDGNAASRVFHITNAVTVTISSLTITNGHTAGLNFPDDAGGGIYNDHATLTVSDCTLIGNSATGSGGGIDNFGMLTIANSTLSGNSAGYGGGGIYNDGRTGSASLTVVDSTLSLNRAVSGGGIWNDGNNGSATLTVSNSTLSGNSSQYEGGGIYNAAFNGGSATLTIANSTLSGNSATFGGGILNEAFQSSATVQIANSTLSGNSAQGEGQGEGGGIYNAGGTLTIANSTVSGNSAEVGCGGIFNEDFGGTSATLEIGSTILNAGASGSTISNQNGTVTSLGYNLSSDDGGGFLTNTGDQTNTPPLLGPLADNGGPTFTHALFPGSPAIDQGKNFSGAATDQRGFPRPVNFLAIANAAGGDGSDIGAFEVQNPDSDGDGVRDDLDSCPNTVAGAVVDTHGCSIDQLVPCSGPRAGGTWRNHGQYVSRVAKAANQFLAAGLITEEQKGEIVSQAARSHCGKRSNGARNVIATAPPGSPKGNDAPGSGQGSPDNKPLGP